MMLPSSPQLAPAKLAPMSPSGTTAPPSTEILFSLPLERESDPLPVRREERCRCPLRSRELGGFRLIQPPGEQLRRTAGCVDQPRPIGRDGDSAPIAWSGQRNIRAQIDIQPHQRTVHRLLHAPRRPQRNAAAMTASTRRRNPWQLRAREPSLAAPDLPAASANRRWLASAASDPSSDSSAAGAAPSRARRSSSARP